MVLKVGDGFRFAYTRRILLAPSGFLLLDCNRISQRRFVCSGPFVGRVGYARTTGSGIFDISDVLLIEKAAEAHFPKPTHLGVHRLSRSAAGKWRGPHRCMRHVRQIPKTDQSYISGNGRRPCQTFEFVFPGASCFGFRNQRFAQRQSPPHPPQLPHSIFGKTDISNEVPDIQTTPFLDHPPLVYADVEK